MWNPSAILRRVWIVVLLCVVPAARGWTPFYDATVEYASASADVVVCGAVRECVPTPSPVAGEVVPWWKVTVRVSERVKGATTGEVVFYVPSYGDGPADWMKSCGDALFFLATTRGRGGSGGKAGPLQMWDQGQRGPLAPVPLGPDGTGSDAWIGADLRMLESRKDVLAAAHKGAAKALSGLPEVVMAPYVRRGWSGGYWSIYVLVPVDADGHREALRWAALADGNMRWNAVRVLRHRQSPEAVGALRTIARAHVSSLAGTVTRELALDALERWGVNVAGLRPGRSVPWSGRLLMLSVVGILVGPTLYVWVVRRRRRVPARWKVIYLAGVSLVLVIWVRSYAERDGVAKGNWEVGCWDGNVCVAARARRDIGIDRPWQIGRAEDLSVVRAYFEERDQFCRLNLGSWALASPPGGGRDLAPQWDWMAIFVIPFWFVTTAAVFPLTIVFAASVVRGWRGQRRIGFPVVLASEGRKEEAPRSHAGLRR